MLEETRKEVNDIIFKVKKMSTKRLQKLFFDIRGKEANPDFYDRQMLIIVISRELTNPELLEKYNREIDEKRKSDRTGKYSNPASYYFSKIESFPKYSYDEIRKIRNLHKYGMSVYELSKVYKVANNYMNNIVTGKIYKTADSCNESKSTVKKEKVVLDIIPNELRSNNEFWEKFGL